MKGFGGYRQRHISKVRQDNCMPLNQGFFEIINHFRNIIIANNNIICIKITCKNIMKNHKSARNIANVS